MVWWATITLAIIGFFVWIPWGIIPGTLIGFYIDYAFLSHGHLQSISYDSKFRGVKKYYFVKSMFSVLGHIAKLDGVVKQEHLNYAEQIMEKMKLNSTLKMIAKNMFNSGKRKSFLLSRSLVKLKQHCGHDDSLLEKFVEAQLTMARLLGPMSEKSKRAIVVICEILQFGVIEEGDHANFFHEQHDDASGEHSDYRRRSKDQHRNYQPRPAANDSYAILGVDRNADKKTVKLAYRKLISQYHPDRVIANGGSEKEVQQATAKTQRIHKAYEDIIDRLKVANG